MSSRVLIVDDSQDIREALARLLRFEGFSVHEATDGADAMSQLKKGLVPDLILVDLVMPTMDGPTFCRELRSSPTYRHIPVIIISGLRSAPGDLSDLKYLRKPFDVKSLLYLIGNLN